MLPALCSLLEQYKRLCRMLSGSKTRLDYLMWRAFRLTIPRPNGSRAARECVPNPRPNWSARFGSRNLPTALAESSQTLRIASETHFCRPESSADWFGSRKWNPRSTRERAVRSARLSFQLMPATAKRYGLRVSPFDQSSRRSGAPRPPPGILGSPRAFQRLALALAAYNAARAPSKIS